MNAFVPCESSDLRSLLIYPPFYLSRLCGLNGESAGVSLRVPSEKFLMTYQG